jgi:hypothetical protein
VDSDLARLALQAWTETREARESEVEGVGIRGVVQPVTGKRIDRVEMRQGSVANTPRPRRIPARCLSRAAGNSLASPMVRCTRLAGR